MLIPNRTLQMISESNKIHASSKDPIRRIFAVGGFSKFQFVALNVMVYWSD